jgi:hypothetical protein
MPPFPPPARDGSLHPRVVPVGSYEAERLIALILAGAAAVVTIVWGPRTLTRGRRPEDYRSS